MIAMALIWKPKLLIADEPTTALDITTQSQILRLLRDLRRDREMALLLITHDLGVVARMAEDIAVMYAGRIVEQGSAQEVLTRPRHPYTRALIGSLPSVRGQAADRLRGIPGTVPAPGRWPVGCRFAPRCELAFDRCRVESPALFMRDGHGNACWLDPAASPPTPETPVASAS
jgi:peptide/nickel transport system ATP-binding protein